ncbi:MAG TPA: hypothetical protein VK838_01950 [Candidatus Limnocylindrales bacterium]|nr:hypothetical protein [Candidatus Limnocylindrales bacterium]
MLPVLFQAGPITLYTYDFFTLFGVAVGVALYYRALRRDRVLDQRIVLISMATRSQCILRRPLLIMGFWAAVAAADAGWLLLLR